MCHCNLKEHSSWFCSTAPIAGICTYSAYLGDEIYKELFACTFLKFHESQLFKKKSFRPTLKVGVILIEDF